jgi:hypothetical protein
MDSHRTATWEHKSEEELSRLGQAYIGNSQLKNTSGAYDTIKTRCNDNEKQNMFARISRRASLTFYSSVRSVWARQE